MGLLPRMKLRQTSSEEQGQIYCAFTNWSIYFAVMALVIGFGNSSDLAAAYGIAVTGTMLIDTILVGFVIVLMWKWPRPLAFALIVAFFLADLAYFSANAPQDSTGRLVSAGHRRTLVHHPDDLAQGPHAAVPGAGGAERPLEAPDQGHGRGCASGGGHGGVHDQPHRWRPSALLHNLKHNQVLHRRNVLLTVKVSERPHVLDQERSASSRWARVSTGSS